jgi:hypothetical protein
VQDIKLPELCGWIRHGNTMGSASENLGVLEECTEHKVSLQDSLKLKNTPSIELSFYQHWITRCIQPTSGTIIVNDVAFAAIIPGECSCTLRVARKLATSIEIGIFINLTIPFEFLCLVVYLLL